MITNDSAQANWKSFVTTSTKYTFTDLVAGHRYWIKQAVVGSNQQLVESESVTYIPQ